MDKLIVVKIGGNIVDDAHKLSAFLRDFAQLKAHKILIHGGGKLATRMAEDLQLPQQMVDGRRVTDAATLRIVTMVYAGLINKDIVAQLQMNGCNGFGLCGADGNAVLAHKRLNAAVDYGFAGDVDAVSASTFEVLLQNGWTPVVAPITHDGNGQLLNTNADTIAQEIALAMAKKFDTVLLYSFEKNGVLLDVDDPASVIGTLTPPAYAELKSKGLIFAGMVPKLDNAFRAVEGGLKKVIIGPAEELTALIRGEKGTTVCHE